MATHRLGQGQGGAEGWEGGGQVLQEGVLT